MNQKSVIRIDNGIFHETGVSLGPFSISIEKGDVCEVVASEDMYSSLFLKGLATLAGIKGDFYFNGVKYFTCDYKSLLNVKRKIAYLGSSCSLLSNRTLIENIYLPQLWEKNESEIKVNKEILDECENAGITEFLYMKPGCVPQEVECGVFIVRELKKKPDIVLLERPYLFTMGRLDNLLKQKIREIYQRKIPVIFSSSTGFIPYSEVTHTINIKDNTVEKTAR